MTGEGIMSKKNNGADFFAGLIFGLMVGAALAILFGPHWREAMRTQLQERSSGLKQSATESWRDARDRAEDIVDDARSRS